MYQFCLNRLSLIVTYAAYFIGAVEAVEVREEQPLTHHC
jgi:hypothetical protein